MRLEHRQHAHRVRLEWGAEGAALLAAECAAVVVVDVLSFCTAVGVAIGRGAAGERWPDGTMRVAVEDALGAGAIAAGLGSAGPGSAEPGDLSPEAEAAVDLFVAARARGPRGVPGGLASGRELIADGFGVDVDLAAELDISAVAPRSHDGFLA